MVETGEPDIEVPSLVSVETGADGPRETAVKYADYALGRFLRRARNSAYWHNTIVLVIADHNSRVYGNQLVPIEEHARHGAFYIPAGSGVMVDNAKVIKTDLLAENGVIHVIDTVILPKS